MNRTILFSLIITLFSCGNNSEPIKDDQTISYIPNDSSVWKIKDLDQFLFFPSDSLFMSLSIIPEQSYYMDSLISEKQIVGVNYFFEKNNDHYVMFGVQWNNKVKLKTNKISDSSFILIATNVDNGRQTKYELEEVSPLNTLPASPLNIWQKEYYSVKQDTLLKYVNNGKWMYFTYFLGGQKLDSFFVKPYEGEVSRHTTYKEIDTFLINPIDDEIYFLQKNEVSNDKGIFMPIQACNLRIKNYNDSIQMRRITDIANGKIKPNTK